MPLRFTCFALPIALMVFAASVARAEVPLDGVFIAEKQCPALQSIRKGTNAGNMATEAGRAYELLAGNKERPSHYLILVPDAEPERRWVSAACGSRAALAEMPDRSPAALKRRETHRPDYVLAVSWQPGFCETKPEKTECATQTEERFDAGHFSLHGLWPQPRSNVYCRASAGAAANDKAGKWDRLPAVTLDRETRAELDRIMPGTASHLDRHEWIKHGTCYGETAEDYFADSLALVRAINESPVATLFSANIGAKLTAARIREAFDDAFGPGAGSRVRVVCVTDPSNGRRLISELTIGLAGDLGAGASFSDILFGAAPTEDSGCPEGIVDAAGFQ